MQPRWAQETLKTYKNRSDHKSLSGLTESRGFPDRVPFDRHHQVHGIAQGALRPDGPREGQGRAGGRGGQIRIRLRIQARRVIWEESIKTSTKTHVRSPSSGEGDSIKHKRISVRLCLWITLSLCSSSCKCFY